MAKKEYYAILDRGVKEWNKWRKENPKKMRIDLRRANLRGEDLFLVDFSSVNLNKAHLSQTYLGWAQLGEARLVEADLELANLIGTNLRDADLRRANLGGAILIGTILAGADLTGAIIEHTTIANVDLSEVRGLEHVHQWAPSTIGIDTIYKSHGKIPEIFLRRCGVPEDMIEFAHSLKGKVFEFYSCFISHSAKDKRFCERLYVDLQAKGVRVWYFPEDAKWGETVWGEIDRSIKAYDKLIVVCSENSLQSVPVNREIERALNREDKEGKNILFPIRIDDYIFEKWEHERKADVVRKVVGDFSGWDKDANKYEKAFDKLLKRLQVS